MPEVTATTPELWSTLQYVCTTFNIDPSTLPVLTSVNQIVDYMYNAYGIELLPLYEEITTLQQTGWTWVVNTPVNPADTTDVVVRGVTDLVVAEGGATSLSQGKKIFGTVSKKIAVGSLIAVLGIDTFASQIGEIIDQLEDFLTPYTTDGNNVPVMIDENGKTYLDSRAIDGFRRGLAGLGVFNLENETTVLPTGEYIMQAGLSFDDAYDLVVGYWSQGYNNCFTRYGYDTDAYKDLIKQYFTDNNLNINNYSYGFWVGQTSGYIYFFEIGQRFNITPATDSGYTVYDLIKLNTTPATAIFRFYLGGTGNPRVPTITRSSVTSFRIPNSNSQVNPANDNKYIPPFIEASTTATNSNIWFRAFSVIKGGGVPGFSPTNTDVGKLDIPLSTIYPDWTSNAVSMPAPKDDDLSNRVDFLPVSITDTEPFTTDHTATADDQEGNTSTDAQAQILEQMMELIQSLLKDPDNPAEVITPTIEVGDSGDTPPYNPPLISGASNGLWTIYNPTLAEVQQFGGWLWSDSIIDSIRRQFASPIDGVIGFMSLYATPITGERKTIKAGYLSSPVSAKEVTNQYITIDCGNVEVPEYYHTAIDYTRSHVSIYLPFIGIIPLDASVVTGSTLNVTYRIDVLTGACLAQIKVIKRNSDAVMYTFTGNCAVQLPLTAGTYTGLIGTLTSLCSGAISAMSGNMIGVGASLMGMARSMGTNVQKSGALASNAGALGIRIPYLILTHPTAYDAFIYNQVYGYPTNIYQRLSDLGGFVRVKDIHLDTISCTRQELQMIYDRLHEGVILT